MAWIESHTVLIRHRKTIGLAIALSVKPVQVIGHLHSLWHNVLEQAEDGDLTEWDDAFIAAAANWDGDAIFFCKALRGLGWMDGNIVHDWLDYAGRYLDSKYRTSQPDRLKQIKAKHKSGNSQTKVRRKTPHLTNHTLPNQPNLPDLQTTIMQNEVLLTSFGSVLGEKVKIYIDRIKNKNKSKVITEGRKNTLLNELSSARSLCNDDNTFGYAL
jgi:hypothetical protein